MSETSSRLQRKFKVAASLLIIGLITEAVTLYWSKPTSFLFFIGVAGFLVATGIVIYLLAIVNE